MSEEEKIKISVNEEDIQNLINCYKKDIEYIMQLEKENKKYKEVIDKAIEYLRSNYIEVLKYHDIPSETTSYEIVTVDLLKILKGEINKFGGCL